MNSALSTILSYSGKIDLFLNINGKTLKISQHNQGTSVLHESICRFLSGQFRGNYDVPTYLDIRNHNSTVSILYNKLTLSSRIYDKELDGTDVNYYVLCECVVPYNSIATQVDSNSSYDLVLCAQPDPDALNGQIRPLATIEISGASLEYIVPGTSALLQWKLYIKNGGN